MLKRLKKPQGGDNWDETLASGYDITVGVTELAAAMAVCSRPTRGPTTHHPSMDGVGTWESSLSAEELLIVNDCYRVEGQFSLGWAWFADHAFVRSLIPTCM